MKTKLLLLPISILIFAFSSCSKEVESVTTYQILNTCSTTTPMEYLDGSLYEVIVFCYNAKDEIIRTDNLEPIDAGGGLSKKVTVTNEIVKVKVSYKMLPPESIYSDLSSNVRMYVVNVFYIEKGKNTTITVQNMTMVKNTISGLSQEIKMNQLTNKIQGQFK